MSKDLKRKMVHKVAFQKKHRTSTLVMVSPQMMAALCKDTFGIVCDFLGTFSHQRHILEQVNQYFRHLVRQQCPVKTLKFRLPADSSEFLQDLDRIKILYQARNDHWCPGELHLDLRDLNTDNRVLFQMLKDFPDLRGLHLSNKVIGVVTIRILIQWSRLRFLRLDGVTWPRNVDLEDYDLMNFFRYFPHLQELSLGGHKDDPNIHDVCNNEILCHLNGMPRLETLHLHWRVLLDKEVKKIRHNLKTLKGLSFTRTSNVPGQVHNDRFLDYVVTLFPDLRRLELVVFDFTPETFRIVSKLEHLEDLTLSDCYQSLAFDAHLYDSVKKTFFHHFPKLKRLSSSLSVENILTQLKHSSDLEVVVLKSPCGVRDDALVHLRSLKKLHTFILWKCAGWSHRGSSAWLANETLAMNSDDYAGMMITDHTLLEIIRHAPNLTHLGLCIRGYRSKRRPRTVGATDIGMSRIAQLKRLRKLDMSGNLGITNQSLPYLEHLPDLQHVELCGTRITSEIASKFDISATCGPFREDFKDLSSDDEDDP
jgi:hypothetical protein